MSIDPEKLISLPGSPDPHANTWALALEQRFLLMHDPAHPEALATPEADALLVELLNALEAGSVQVVEQPAPGQWRAVSWVKRALSILPGLGTVQSQPGVLPGSELSSLGWLSDRPLDRRVPAGSFIRRGACLERGCTIMPPSTVQVGACVRSGVRVDSHVLVGTGVRLEPGVQIGCGTMLGGLLLPEEALPVVIEQDVIVGGNCGLYGSLIVGEGSSVYAGTVIRSAAGAYDLRSSTWIMPDSAGLLRLPAGVNVEMGFPPDAAFPDGLRRPVAVLR